MFVERVNICRKCFCPTIVPIHMKSLVREHLFPHQVFVFDFCSPKKEREGEESLAPFLKSRVTWWTVARISFYHFTHSSFQNAEWLSDFWVSHPLVPLFKVAVAINAFSFSCPSTFEVYSPPLILILWLIPLSWVERWTLRKCVMPFSGLFTLVCQGGVGLDVTARVGLKTSSYSLI